MGPSVKRTIIARSADCAKSAIFPGLTTSVSPVVSCFGEGTCQKGEKWGTSIYMISAIGNACANNCNVLVSDWETERLGAKCVANVINNTTTKPL